jgi:Flp pilus assembly pilin Flp
MKDLLKRAGKTLSRLHRDESGAEGLEKLLIIAAIVLPLLGLLIFFRNEIKDWVRDLWDTQRTEAENWDVGP